MMGMHRVDHGNDGIQLVVFGDVLLDEKSLRHRCRIGQTGGFYDNSFEVNIAAFAPLGQFAQDAHQVAAYGATNATVVHCNYLLVGLHQQFVVDAGFTEFVFDHGNTLPVMFGQNPIQ
jgi:hypothetical protein